MTSNLLNRFETLKEWLNGRVIGQQSLVNRLLLALLCGGHLIVEGAPGLAKTRVIKELAKGIEGDFHRIQFTPDLLPSDVTGTEIFRMEEGSFHFQQGPIFHNLVLADEVNRAPAKVQSALLEAMAEKQVTIGRETYPLPNLFLVMATQNPIEQEGTYPLPEAQLDRFLMHVKVDYPSAADEKSVLNIVRNEFIHGAESIISPTKLAESEIMLARRELNPIHMEESIENYIVELVNRSRGEISGVDYGVSPRATIALDLCARAQAWLQARDFVTPEDIQTVINDVFRHRLILTYEATARGITADSVTNELINTVPVP